MIGLGTAVSAPLQNTVSPRAGGNGASLPENQSNGNTASQQTQLTSSAAETEEARQAVPPLSADGLRSLLQAQEQSQSSPFDSELTPEEEEQVRELKQRDAEVRAHEQAHKTAGGPVAGNVSYQTVTGPDGRQYAVAGEVQIDASPVPNNPEATIRKMDLVIRAALAPAEPSPQDRAVAAQAQQTKFQAQQEAAQQRAEEQEEQRENNELGLLSRLENLQNDKFGVQRNVTEVGTSESGDDSASEIVSILFGNIGN